jgi:hypothetical protein
LRRISFFLAEIPFKYLAVIPVFIIIVFRLVDTEIDPGMEENGKKVYEIMENVPAGSKVLVITNYGPEAKYELEETLSAMVGYFASKETGIVFATLVPVGVESAFMAVERSIGNPDFIKERYLYGYDYAHIGYIGGGTVGAFLLSSDISGSRKKDIYGNELKTLPVMNGIESFSDFSAVFEFSSRMIDGTPGMTLFSVLSGDKDLVKAVICSSDMVPNYLPFYQSGSFDGFAGGFRDIAGLTKTVDPSSGIWKRYYIMSMILEYIFIIIILSGIRRFLRGDR